MNRCPFPTGLVLLMALSLSVRAQLVREPNTTISLPAAITTSGQYELADTFPNLSFDKPVCVATPPGETNRIFVVERAGRIIVVNDLANPTKEVFLDITPKVHAADWITSRRTEGLSSIAFHPNFASNHRFFVTYNTVTTTSQGSGHHNRVAEYKANDDNRTAISGSEIALITQIDEGEGHNINDLHFGPDGYLYIATGDEGDGGTGDDYFNAQKINKDFFSALMRIDVDNKAENRNPNPHPAANSAAYKIPADNPYVGATSFNGLPVDPNKVRTEFFAVGLRNPWRFSFDPLTGKIYEGDVGQHGREEINRIVKGGNYGWSYKEGTANGVYAPPPNFSFIGPIFEYGPGMYGLPGNSFSITGGVVYRGLNPGLDGHLFFSDYVTGHIWSMNIDNEPPGLPTLRFAEAGVASFGYDPRNGDVLAVNHDQGKIKRVKYTATANNLPASLADTGVFSNIAGLVPNTGIYGYDVNVPLWSDGAAKRRWFSIPDVNKRMTFSADGRWTFPQGSVWVKHFEIETNPGDPSSTMRLETRLLYKTSDSVYGITYKWNESGTAASLVAEEGDSRQYSVSGQTRTWRFPSRSDCMSCHTEASGRIIGFNTGQMNRNYGYGRQSVNQIAALSSAQFFDVPLPPTNLFRTLAPLNDTTASLADRAKSYLAANCANCHQPGTSAHAIWDGRATTPLSDAHIILGRLVNASDTTNKVVMPGDVSKSAIIQRMMSQGADRMPPLGVHVPDNEAIQLLKDWINSLNGYETYDAWSGRVLNGVANGRDQDADGDGISNFTEYLAGTNPREASSPFSMTKTADQQITLSYQQPANRGFVIEYSDELPSDSWSLLNDSQNWLNFPAESASRSFTDTLSPSRPMRMYRLRVFEP